MRDQRDAGLSHRIGGPREVTIIGGTQAEPVADRHLTGHSGRKGPIGNGGDLRQSMCASIVQMNVYTNSPPLGDIKQDRQLAVEIIVDNQGIKPAEKIGTFLKRRLQKIRGAGATHDPRLRKSDDLYIDVFGKPLADFGQGMNM